MTGTFCLIEKVKQPSPSTIPVMKLEFYLPVATVVLSSATAPVGFKYRVECFFLLLQGKAYNGN